MSERAFEEDKSAIKACRGKNQRCLRESAEKIILVFLRNGVNLLMEFSNPEWRKNVPHSREENRGEWKKVNMDVHYP